MEYRPLANTDLKISVVGVGCMTFGWRANANEVDAIVSAATDVGINLFDTSVSYGRGVSETLLGDALKRSGRRNEIVVATKFGQAATPDAKLIGNSRRVLMAQCELSLRRLQTDRIDLLQIHNFSAEVPIEESLGGLHQLVRDGKVRYIGCCNFTGRQLTAAIQALNNHHWCGIASHQAGFNILDRRAETDVMSVAQHLGVGNLVYSPLAEGLLTGKYRIDEEFPANSRFAVASPANNYRARLTPRVSETLTLLSHAAAEHSLSLWKLALAWVLACPAVSCALVGPSTSTQVRQLNEVADLVLDSGLLGLVESINPAGASIVELTNSTPAQLGPSGSRPI